MPPSIPFLRRTAGPSAAGLSAIFPRENPQGTDNAGMPARFDDIVNMSDKYICSGSCDFSPILNARRRRRGRRYHVHFLESILKIPRDKRADLLRFAVISVVITRRKRVGAKHYPSFYFRPETLAPVSFRTLQAGLNILP